MKMLIRSLGIVGILCAFDVAGAATASPTSTPTPCVCVNGLPGAGASGCTTCTSCYKGFYLSSQACVACGLGLTVPEGSTSSTACGVPSDGIIGCYKDCTPDCGTRAMHLYLGFVNDNTVASCAAKCRGKSEYFGVEYGGECYCDTDNTYTSQGASTGCSMACTGDSGSKCGGSKALTVGLTNFSFPTPAPSTTLKPSTAVPTTSKPSTGAPITVKPSTALPTLVPTTTPTSSKQPTVKPTTLFCTSTRCKNGGHCSIGDTKCTCVGGFSGRTCTITPSPTSVPTQAPTTPKPSTSPTSAPTSSPQPTLSPVTGTPLPCPRVVNPAPTLFPNPSAFVPLASGTYSIPSSLVCLDPVTSAPSRTSYEVLAGSVVVINIPVEGVTLTSFRIVISGGSVTINGGPITYTKNTITSPLDVYDGGSLTINSDIIYTANSYQMITCGSKDYKGNAATPLRPGGIVTFAGSGSFTSNARTCSSLVCTWAAAIALANGCSFTFKKNVEFKNNTVPTSTGSSGVLSYGGAISVYESTLVFEADVLFDSNKAYHGGALWIYVSSTVTFKGFATFLNNNAASTGGAIENIDSTVKFLSGSVFSGNTAFPTGPSGGAIDNYSDQATARTKFCTALPTGTDVSVAGKFECSGCQTTIATC